MSSTTNQLINQIREGYANPISSVMGSSYEKQMLQQLTGNDELRQQIATAATLDDTAALHKLIIEQLVEPIRQKDETERRKLARRAEDALTMLQQQTAAITASTGATVALKAVRAKSEFEASRKIVTDIVSRLNKTEKRTDKFNTQINALCYNDDDDDDTGELDEETIKRITELQTRRDQLTKETKQLQQQLFNHFDETLGGLSTTSKQDKKPLTLPKNLEKTTTRQMTDAIKSYMSHRATEYYAILPYVKYVTDSYDPQTGTYTEPPNKTKHYEDVPECLRSAYEKQAERLYREVLACITQSEMAKITSTFTCGLNKDKKARCSVDDGPMAIYCLLSKYGKNDAYSITDLEDQFKKAPHHFTFGSPAVKVQYLRPYLAQVMELGVTLKSSDTIRPVIDILSDRHPKFAVALNKYANGGDTPHDCAATLEQMFSDIEAACHSIERSVGPQIWQAQTHAHNTMRYDGRQGKGGKGQQKGKGNKGKGGKGRFITAHQVEKGKGGKGNKGGKGKHGIPNGSCTAEGCRASSGRFRFCIECFKQGMDKGFIKCKDGYTQKLEKTNRKGSDQFGFSGKQKEGLVAFGNHVATTIIQQMSEGEHSNKKQRVAHQVDPFAQQQLAIEEPQTEAPATKRVNVFKRMGEAHLTEKQAKKKMKQTEFIESLSQYGQ
jgi:hypothetical protein